MIYFGADWHLYHKKVLQFTNRPFDDIDIMKECFLYEWRSKVAKEDIVYLLGDVTFSNKAIEDLEGLPGYKVLIKGNHDPNKFSFRSNIWDETADYAEIKVGDQHLVLMHFPIESWHRMGYGAIHLHGHTHNNISHEISKKRNRIDVGYDHTNQALSTLDELLELQRQEEIADKFN